MGGKNSISINSPLMNFQFNLIWKNHLNGIADFDWKKILFYVWKFDDSRYF